jgi:hypothetical protein
VTLNLQDPDSMTLDPRGDILLDSQADSELLIVQHPGTPAQSVLQVPLSSPFGTPQSDDTIFTPGKQGFILVADTPANIVYAIHKSKGSPDGAYTAALAGTTGFVGTLDLESGQLTPVVTGLQSPHGMAFVPASDQDDDDSWWAQFDNTDDVLFGNH